MSNNRSAIPVSAGQVSKELLKFKSGGPSVEEARAEMLAAKESAKTFKGGEKVPTFIADAKPETTSTGMGMGGNTPVVQDRVAAELVVEPVAEPEIVPEPVAEVVPEPVAAVQPEPVRVAAEPEDTEQRERYEEKHFILEIYKDNKEWVAELVYKNGAGTERFVAPSKHGLLVKLGIGKGHGTVKVRQAVQDGKLGRTFDSWDKFYDKVLKDYDHTQEEFYAMPKKSQDLIKGAIEVNYIEAFIQNYPEYYKTEKNWANIIKYLDHNKIPLTLHNLELAYRDLMDEDPPLLEQRPNPSKEIPPAKTAEVISAPAVATKVEDSTSVPVPATPAPAVVTAPTPATPVRKRASTGLIPGQSSAAPSAPVTEDGTKPSEPSEKELKDAREAANRGDMAPLRRLALAGRKYGARY